MIPILQALDEQCLVSFTGRLNILDKITHQLLGVVVLKDGHIFRCQYRGIHGLKAFYNLVIEGAQLVAQDFIVEPEIIEESDRDIHYPYTVLKTKGLEALARYEAVAHQRPPADVKLLAKATFLDSDYEVSDAEFTVLCALSEWSLVGDLYRHCSLLDHEITESLVSLRRKEALQVIVPRSGR